MRGLLWILGPAAVAAALLTWGGAPYAMFLSVSADLLDGALPARPASQGVLSDGSLLVVLRPDYTEARVDVGAIAWDLPVLGCLWAWVVRRRWKALACVSLLFVALHVVVADIEIRKALGGASGWPYAFTRAWFIFGSSALPAFAVAFGWALPGRRAGPPPSSRDPRA